MKIGYGSKKPKYDYFNVTRGDTIEVFESNTKGIWSVQSSYGQIGKKNSGFWKHFKTKSQAMKYALDYMRTY